MVVYYSKGRGVSVADLVEVNFGYLYSGVHLGSFFDLQLAALAGETKFCQAEMICNWWYCQERYNSKSYCLLGQ